MEDKYTEVEKEWFHAYMEFVNNRQMATGRKIIVTKFDGNYGTAGFVIAINGSPPKGVMIVVLRSGGCSASAGDIINPLEGGPQCWVMDGEKFRTVNSFRYRLKKSKHARLLNATNALLIARKVFESSANFNPS